MPSLARLSKRFRAAGTNGRLDLSLTWRVSEDSDFKAYPAWSISSSRWNQVPELYLVLNVGGQQQILSVKNCQRYLLRLVLWPSEGQTLLQRQVEMTCDQQPPISRF